jgi:hypothetical protein
MSHSVDDEEDSFHGSSSNRDLPSSRTALDKAVIEAVKLRYRVRQSKAFEPLQKDVDQLLDLLTAARGL